MANAIDEAKIMIVIISLHSLSSHQVAREIEQAHAENKLFLPSFVDVSHAQFVLRRPPWRLALGSSTAIELSRPAEPTVIGRITDGVQVLLRTPRPCEKYDAPATALSFNNTAPPSTSPPATSPSLFSRFFFPPEAEMPKGAVFISYSRSDLEAVKTLKSALDKAGIVTWLDLDRLEGGDAYSKKIEGCVRNCSYFIPIISSRTIERDEAFFWREWGLAIERLWAMAPGAIFILPVIIDDTPPKHPRIPEKFQQLHIYHLPGGKPGPEFVARLNSLMKERQA